MFGTEAQTELDDLKVVATKSGGEMKYIARTGEGSRPRQIGDLRAPGYRNQSGHHGLSRLTRMADTVHNDFASTDVTPQSCGAAPKFTMALNPRCFIAPMAVGHRRGAGVVKRKGRPPGGSGDGFRLPVNKTVRPVRCKCQSGWGLTDGGPAMTEYTVKEIGHQWIVY